MSISSQLIKLNDIKIAIREALAEKGADIDETTLFSKYASLIEKLPVLNGFDFTEIITDTFNLMVSIPDTVYISSAFNMNDTVEQIETESEE